MNFFKKSFAALMIASMAVVPTFGMDSEVLNKISTDTMKFADDTQITLSPNGNVFIVNDNESMDYNEIDKPVFANNETKESVLEYSGPGVDKNEKRSWAKATFEPSGFSAPHFHKERTEDYYITSENAKLLVTLDGKELYLKTGDHLRILPGQVHAVKNLSDSESFSLIVKCSPSWIYTDHNIVK